MTEPSARSKRMSLRFAVADYKLRYKTEFEDGTARLSNISAGGCALCDLNVTVSLHEKILLVLDCDDEQQIEIGCVVVRVVQGTAAVRFTQLSEDHKQKIVVYFAALQRMQRAQ